MEVVGTGTATLVNGAPQVIATISTPGTYVFIWDMSALNNDLTIDFATKILTGGSEGIIYTHAVVGATYDESTVQSEPIVVNHSATITATAANDVSDVEMPWRLVKISQAGGDQDGTSVVEDGTNELNIGTGTDPGVYVLQLDMSFNFSAGTLSVGVDVTDPAGYSALSSQFTAAPAGTTFWQSPPILVLDEITFALTNASSGETWSIPWSLTKVP